MREVFLPLNIFNIDIKEPLIALFPPEDTRKPHPYHETPNDALPFNYFWSTIWHNA